MTKTVAAALFGGDMRQIYLGETLSQAGWEIGIYGIDIPEFSSLQYKKKAFWKQILKDSKVIIAPIPFTRDKKHIFQRNSDALISIEEFIEELSPSQFLFGGNIPDTVLQAASSKHVTVFDFMKDNEITSFNAIATAEGSIMEAIRLSPFNIEDSQLLIIGYGCCGTVLAQKCKLLGAHVTVAVRRKELIPFLNAKGYHAMLIDALSDKINEFQILFNTVPSLILTAPLLGKIQKDSVIIDIASEPGGIDKESALECHFPISHFLGIPGKIAPKASASKLAEIIQKKLKEVEYK